MKLQDLFCSATKTDNLLKHGGGQMETKLFLLAKNALLSIVLMAFVWKLQFLISPHGGSPSDWPSDRLFAYSTANLATAPIIASAAVLIFFSFTKNKRSSNFSTIISFAAWALFCWSSIGRQYAVIFVQPEGNQWQFVRDAFWFFSLGCVQRNLSIFAKLPKRSGECQIGGQVRIS